MLSTMNNLVMHLKKKFLHNHNAFMLVQVAKGRA